MDKYMDPKVRSQYSPMMQQYLDIKEQNMDAIVFFRLGDFYEMFFEDAKLASKELEITLTGRDAGTNEKVPMCGIPFHSANSYIEKLIAKGYKVAIIEQTEAPGKNKGPVNRDVARIITPGTLMESNDDSINNNFIAAVIGYEFNLGVAYCDVTTGEFNVMLININKQALENFILTNNIKELVVTSSFDKKNYQQLKDKYKVIISHEDNLEPNNEYDYMFVEVYDERMKTVSMMLINYLVKTQRRSLEYLQEIKVVAIEETLQMDIHTKENLELTRTIRGQDTKGTLYWLLNKTKTIMGARLLKQWIESPLVDLELIHKRQDVIQILIDNFIERELIQQILSDIYDIERLTAKLSYGMANARDIKQLGKSLSVLPQLKEALLSLENPLTDQLADSLLDMHHLSTLVEDAIADNPPISIRDGGMIKEGFNNELDHYFDARKNGKNWILDLENAEKERTGIKNLKISYNKVFGYYIEVTRSQIHLIKDEFEYQRKQSVANAERYITPKLKEMEMEILTAEENIVQIEYDIFCEIRDFIRKEITELQHIARMIATIDVFQSLALVGAQNSYVRPEFNDDHIIEIIGGRHPMIEQAMFQEIYVENDIHMDEECDLLLVTGPNMGGKSTYMRQVAILAIMAQIGSYVSATKANLPIFDRIFTRIGASDDLMAGQSTFMVEMMEANYAIQNATLDSLVIFDEIGRGTATYDGMAIAQSLIEYIVTNIKAKTMFSTHYHELTVLDKKYSNIKNVHVSVDETDDHVTFLYKVQDGVSGRSYGVNVAKLAGLPDEILDHAKALLEHFESTKAVDADLITKIKAKPKPKAHPVLAKLKGLDPYAMNPMEAINVLYELKKMSEGDGRE